MHIAHSRPVAALAHASARRVLDGQRTLIAIIGGVTALAFAGGVLSSNILSDGSSGSASSTILSDGSGGSARSHSLPSYAAYNTQETVPTSFGSFSVTRADLTSLADAVEVHVSMRVDNNQDTQVDAPRLDDLRLINTLGADAYSKPGAWSGPAVMIGHSIATVDLKFLAPQDMGLLWLEYRDPAGQWPIRVALGFARAPQPATAAGLGEVR